ncbi:MAG: DUF1156 domain-containing protein [Acidimicrobiia bacterium]|nr:DUF1156 domain-containing protein [Acidimicrobiia bacterium]MCY4434046.1 DUF1156 domain-containing protein [bacterium]
MGYRRKLIEVALPLDAINAASAREKSIRHGHPSTLHLWWSRKPLAACRAVLFASLIDDPSSQPDRFPTEAAQNAERKRLFELIEELVVWENSNDPEVLVKARAEVAASCDGHLPPVLDPFAGGGSIPLEAQRLGLEAHASDLNPVAVLINKAMIEIPPLFAGQPPVHPDPERPLALGSWPGAQGLAADVKYYGQWIREQAAVRIGHHYPKVELPAEHGGGQTAVIAWLWTRTVTCPNPACAAEIPLASTWWLSKKSRQPVWVDPAIDPVSRTVDYRIGTNASGPPQAPKQGRAQFRCIFCAAAVPNDYVKAEAQAHQLEARLTAIVAENGHRRVYLPPNADHEAAARNISKPPNPPTGAIANDPRAITVTNWGLSEWADLFTNRQLTALCVFADLVSDAQEQVLGNALSAGMKDDPTPLSDGGCGAAAYAEAVSVYLAFAVSKCADRGSGMCTWDISRGLRSTFARQALPMNWDYAETNPFSDSAGNWSSMVDFVHKALSETPATGSATVMQREASSPSVSPVVVSTDPPYYDNIGYSDLSDFFYMWLRRSVGGVFSEVCSTLLAPKSQELVAAPYRHNGDKRRAKQFFESGLEEVFTQLRDVQDPRFPMSVFYAFKQAETTDDGGTASTGWETMLEGLIGSGFQITGTWPVRSELASRMRSQQSNALASSIVLVCRPRPGDAPLTSRREFLDRLTSELPDALSHLRDVNIAPVDLAQAAIGPGMAIYSRYSKVIEADGNPMGVRAALAAINQTLDEALESAEADLDTDTRWALTWHSQHGFQSGDYGLAEQLSKSRNTSVAGLVTAGIAASHSGKVRLLAREELDENWSPADDHRLTVWEVVQYLIRELEIGGEQPAADLLRQVGGLVEPARELAYRLYHTCERKGWASDALAYNSLVSAWPELTRLANKPPTDQTTLGL